jgi:hypothetical protein
MMNICLNGVYLVRANFCSSLLPPEPVFVRVVDFVFSIFDILQTGIRLPFIPDVLRDLGVHSFQR